MRVDEIIKKVKVKMQINLGCSVFLNSPFDQSHYHDCFVVVMDLSEFAFLLFTLSGAQVFFHLSPSIL